GNIESVKELISENTAAIFLELIQGEGGVNPLPQEFPKALRELCDEKDIILVDDEVQTGFGRTGKMFAYEHYDIVPDVVCMAKAIAGGVPMGATIASEDLYDKLEIGEHNITFGGNPLACAAANATIDIIIEEKLIENSAKQGEKIISNLSKFSEESNVIREVRGKGLMIGIEYKKKTQKILDQAEKMGVLLLKTGLTVVRIVPPLIINDNQVKKVLEVVRKISE
ncbi:MAG: aminotransferase class III-fold pyridoxal phosphate-dependent enzyme, partial [Promethearchaeota archaeon]